MATDLSLDATADEDEPFGIRVLALGPQDAGGRVDKTLAEHLPEMSRARIQALIAQGRVSRDGAPIADGSAKALAGDYRLEIPPPVAAEPAPEAIPLTVLYEDADLIVVHRIDKDTSGIVVAATTDAAHQGLSALFAAHDIDRVYVALTRGAPRAAKGVIEGAIGRSSADRKKMALVRSGGRHAVTHYAVARTFGPKDRPLAARIACTLETGLTHQIRVHLASIGAPCLGDPLYGSGPPALAVRAAIAEAGLRRQALHAAVLGFRHPVTGQLLSFESPLPPDMAKLEALLGEL